MVANDATRVVKLLSLSFLVVVLILLYLRVYLSNRTASLFHPLPFD